MSKTIEKNIAEIFVNKIEDFIEVLRKELKPESKHCILLLEETQKELNRTQLVNLKTLKLLEEGFITLPLLQVHIYDNFMEIKNGLLQSDEVKK